MTAKIKEKLVPFDTTMGSLRLHKLTMVDDVDGVMVGRPDIGSYALFPPVGAEMLRRIGKGSTVAQSLAFYEATCGQTLDALEFLEAINELNFIVADGEDPSPAEVVRFQRLGRLTFGLAACLLYTVVTLTAIAMMIGQPRLRPTYRNLFFTDRISLIPIVIMFCGLVCIAVHECFHSLAGRRLGLPSTFGFGRRINFLVAETRLDALLSVPRRQRYLPFLAGMIADVVVFSGLTVTAAVLRAAGSPHWIWACCLAVAFTCVLRLLSHLLFYLETVLYYVITNALRCDDLQSATRYLIRTRLRRLFGRSLPHNAPEWTVRERAFSRRYASVLIAGYVFTFATFLWAGLPTALRFWSTAMDRLASHHTSVSLKIDAVAFLVIDALPTVLVGFLAVKDWSQQFRQTKASKGVPE